MAPVMIGSIFLGNAKYSSRQYLQVITIILGTVVVGLSGGKKGNRESSGSWYGIIIICGSLVCDGLTGGLQKGMKEEMKKKDKVITPYEFMLYTNFSMALIAFVVALFLGGEVLRTVRLAARSD